MDFRIKEANSNEDLITVNRLAQYAFDATPSEEVFQGRMTNQQYREESYQILGLVGETPAATASIHPMSQNVRYSILPMAGVATVATLPGYRRKGLVSRMMNDLFKYCQNRYPVSVLHPFRESFYARYGYTKLPDRIQMMIPPKSLSSLLNVDMDPIYQQLDLKVAKDEIFDIIQEVQKTRPGMVTFSRKKFGEIAENDYWALIADFDDVRSGMIFKNTGYMGDLLIRNLYYNSTTGLFMLLKFMALHIDQVKQVKFPIRSQERLDLKILDVGKDRKVGIGAMVRITDLRLLDGLQVGTGKIVIRVTDSYCNWNNGVWEFISENGLLSIKQLDAVPEVELPIDILTAIVYGVHDFELYKLVQDISIPETIRIRLEKLFPSLLHHVQEYY